MKKELIIWNLKIDKLIEDVMNIKQSIKQSCRNIMSEMPTKEKLERTARLKNLLEKSFKLKKENDLARKHSQSNRQKAWYLRKKTENSLLKTADESNDSILKENLN